MTASREHSGEGVLACERRNREVLAMMSRRHAGQEPGECDES